MEPKEPLNNPVPSSATEPTQTNPMNPTNDSTGAGVPPTTPTPPLNNKKTMWIVMAVVAAVILVGVLLWVLVLNKPQEDSKDVTVNDNTTINDNNQAVQAPAPEEISLVAIAPYTGTASSTRLLDNNVFTNTISATTADPAPGKFYEGWLVKKLPGPPVFFSTGKLVKTGGMYKLTYTADKDPVGYNQVVVTEETEANGLDGKPEAHVFEGDFK